MVDFLWFLGSGGDKAETSICQTWSYTFQRVTHLVGNIPQMVMNPIRKKSPTKQIQDCINTLRIQVCPKKGTGPLHSYAFWMGLEPKKSSSREGSGSLGLNDMA